MASKKVVTDGDTKDKVDEVTDIKLESEDDDGSGMLPRHSSEILDSDIDEEIELFLKQELVSKQEVSEDGVTQKPNTSEKSRNTSDAGNGNVAGLVPECRVTIHGVDDSSEIKQSVQFENNVPEKRDDQTEILHKKRLRDSDVEVEKEIDYGSGIVVESGTNCLEIAEHSDNVSGSKNKTDQSVFDVKAKDAAETKSVETTSVRTYLINRDLSPLWDSYILAVKGIPPKESGRLKQVLNDVLGSNRHRVRPRQKGDTIVYLHFITLEDMRIAKETLTTQGVANYKLTVTVESSDERKSKSEAGNEGPVSKKMKHHPVVQFYEEAYDKQIEFKVKDITSRLQYLEKDILKVYPTYSRLIHQRRLQHDGAICAVDKLKDCPPTKRVASSCWFAVGASEETGQLALGIYQGSGHVRKLSSVKHNYPDHVVKAAEVFEEFLLAEETRKICRKLLIYTNRVKDLMLLVFVHDTSHVKQVGDEMKEFFTSGDGAKCQVTSIHVKVMKSNHDIKDGVVQLVVGVPCLHETVAGLELQLPPVKNLWNTIHGAEMLCQALEELLAPTKKTTLLDIGCGIGLLGLYLSKMAGEVLGVDNDVAVAVATKNAELNGITDCGYFAGDADVTIPELAKKMKYDSVCAVVTCCINNSYRSGRAMEELRKIQHLDRLVLVEDRTMSSGAILSLNKPSSEKIMGNPFFPSKVVPVDCLPNSKGYVLLVLLERVNSDDIRKFGIDSKPVAAESELKTKGSASRKPFERDSKVRQKQGDRRWLLNTPWDRGAFEQHRYGGGGGAMQNSLLRNTASYRHFRTADELGACVGTVNNLMNVASEYELRRQMEEDYRRQMIEEEEEHRHWLAKEEQRRLMEEIHLRQVQEEDWIRWVRDEQMRRIPDEERRRIEEEEWRRQIDEERMREIQEEEEQMRRIQEERMREIQEERMREIQEERMREIQEEERMRRIQEERMRGIQEEERMRQIQEEERMRRIQEDRMRAIQEEEEEMRRIQEERMREIQEEERMRRIQEERMRQIQEEEERMRRIQEERMRAIQEKERMRQIQEEEERMRRIQEERMRAIQEEEERMRQIQEEEERMRRIQEERMRAIQEEEERMRQIQEERLRGIQEEEERMRRIQEERMREIQEEERMRQIQEEEERMRRIQEERMRAIQEEEERLRQIQEERLRGIQEEEERMRRIQEECMRAIQEEERMRQIQEEEDRMRRLQEERMRQIQEEEQIRRMREIQDEERIRQIQEERMRQIHEEEYRRIEEKEWRRQVSEDEWRRQVSEDEWRRHMQEEQRRVKEEEWRRQIQKEKQRKIKDEEWRRKMQREGQKRPVLGETCSEKVVEEEQLRRPVKEEKERELVRGSAIRRRNDLMQDQIADSPKAAAIPQLSADTTQKVKHFVAEASNTVGAKEASGISHEDKTVSLFGTSDKELSQSRHMEEEYMRYIREVESAHDHNHDTSQGTVVRYGREQNDLEPQQHADSTKPSEKLPSLLDLKLNRPEYGVESSFSPQHSEDRGGDTNQWQRRLPIVRKEFNSQAEHVRPTDRSFNRGNQARDFVRRDEMSVFSSVTENTADIYLRRGDLDQERRRNSARQDRTDFRGTGNRNAIARLEHSGKDHRHMFSRRPSTRPWLDSN